MADAVLTSGEIRVVVEDAQLLPPGTILTVVPQDHPLTLLVAAERLTLDIMVILS